MVALLPVFKKAYWTLAALGFVYCGCIALLLHPWVQRNALYMNKLTLTGFRDLTIPEQFGFARGQATPLYIPPTTPSSGNSTDALFAWHILPLSLYAAHRATLSHTPAGVATNPADTPQLRLLRDDPEARLIIHFHGNAGTVGAAARPAYLRSLSAASTGHIHVLAIDYRGFGLSPGVPSEVGLIADGVAAVQWAETALGVPRERIALVGQSLGAAVAVAVAERFASTDAETPFAAVVSIAGFSDLRALLLTYRVGGVLPILAPLRGYPSVQRWIAGKTRETWRSSERVVSLVQKCAGLRLVLVHARDDWEIPVAHVRMLWEAGVGAGVEGVEGKVVGMGAEGMGSVWEEEKGEEEGKRRRVEMWEVGWGGHNQIVGTAVTSVVVKEALGL
ncbi:Alpha/Beta hydrolase protein [Geopyxis carbonaria]|nr:Alpha/Beta hydrolase protein [Geopyxis carbonaria]